MSILKIYCQKIRVFSESSSTPRHWRTLFYAFVILPSLCLSLYHLCRDLRVYVFFGYFSPSRSSVRA